jgi:hypothetical protein
MVKQPLAIAMLATFITAIHLAALGQIESGDRDAAVGRDGEVTRYQVLPSVAAREWRESLGAKVQSPKSKAQSRLPDGWARDTGLATALARGIWENRAATFRVANRRDPMLPELYMLWHRPGRVLAPRRRELARARRFETVAQALTLRDTQAEPRPGEQPKL